jgi:teichuronic acid exporter
MKLEDLRRAALVGARWTIASRIGLQLITWPVTILVMRLLDPGDYGLFAIAMIVIGFVALFGELGLSTGLVQAAEVDQRTQRAAASLIALLNTLVAIALLLAAPWLADAFDKPTVVPLIQVLTIELALLAVAAVPQAMLERRLAFRELAMAQIIGALTASFATITAALAGFGVWALVVGVLVQSTVRTISLLSYHGGVVLPGPITAVALRPIRHVSGHAITARALWFWCGQADQIVLARLLQATLLGAYAVAAQLAMLPAAKAMEAVNRVAFPIISKLHGQPAAIAATHRKLIGMLALYGFGICWGMAAVAPEFVTVVLGTKWQASVVPLTMLCLVVPLRMLSALQNTIATAVGTPQAVTKEMLLASLLIPTAVAAGALIDGLRGASVAWLVVYPPIYLMSNYLTCRSVGVPAFAGLRPLGAPLAAGLAMFITVAIIRSHFAGDGPGLALAAQIVAGGLTYCVVLLVSARPRVAEAWMLAREFMGAKRARAPHEVPAALISDSDTSR